MLTPTAALAGPVALMLTAQALHRRQLVGNAVPVISWACVAPRHARHR